MSENEITVDGVTYVAAERATCRDCAFDDDTPRCRTVTARIACSGSSRSDKSSIIWLTKLQAAVHRLKGGA